MKKSISKFLSVLLTFIIVAGLLPANVYADVAPSEQAADIDAQVAEMEDKIGRVEGSDMLFEPSEDLVEYANKKINFENPTRILDYSSETHSIPSEAEAREYFIKAATEGHAGMVLYGDKEFAKRTIESVVYSASYGIYLKHLRNWKIESQLIDQTNDIYRHLVTFQYNMPKSHTIELEERIDAIAGWILKEYKNVNIPEEMKTLNHLDEKGVEDLQKAMLIHDYVVKNVRPYYGDLTFFGKTKSERHSLNSAMFEGETVCQGFQLIFARLADRVGLENRLVRGYKGFVGIDKKDAESKKNYIYQMKAAVEAANKGGRWGMDESTFGANHGWNQVKIGDKWYHADMSSDSSLTNTYFNGSWPKPQYMYYRYFLKTDKEFKEPVKSYGLLHDGTPDGKPVDVKQFVVWQGSENYDTPDEKFLWTYDILYAYEFNQGINSKPYLQNNFAKTYPMGNSWDDKGRFKFEEKDLTYVPETRYEMTVPGYEDGVAPLKIRSGLQTPEEALKSAGVSGIMFKDGNRTDEGYVDFGAVKSIDVKHDNAEEKEEFNKIKDTVGEKVTLTAYFEAEGQRYEEKVELVIAEEGEFKSSTDLRLKEGAEDIITLPQHVYVNNNHIENKRQRDVKIAEIDNEILSRVEVLKDGSGISVRDYSGERRIIWKNTEFNNDNAPIGEPTKDENYLVRTILVKGEDGKWTSMDFKINLTEVEKKSTTVIECDVDYIQKKASDKTGTVYGPKHRSAGQEIDKGGDFSRFFEYNGHRINMGYTNALGLFSQRLQGKTVYVLDEEGNPKYKTEKFDNGILLAKDDKGEFTVKTEDTLNKLFLTQGLYKFRIEAFNDYDKIVVKKDFTVKILGDDEAITYTVTFDANGHGEAPAALEVEEGKTADNPGELTEKGWKFEGWYSDKEGKTEFDFGKEIKSNTTVYAKWSKAEEEPPAANKYTVKFDANGHGISPAEETVEEGRAVAEPEALTEEGWVFGGWYKEADCINAYDFETAVTENITLYAKWTESSGGGSSSGEGSGDDIGIATPSNYTVSFDANGHGNAPEAQKVKEGERASKPSNPSESGYIFGGWYEEAECIDAYDFEKPVTENIILYAKWSKKSGGSSSGGSDGIVTAETYTVNFDANGHGKAPDKQKVEEGRRAVKPSNPAESGYDFAGWYKEAECSNAYDFETPVTENITLYAKWMRNLSSLQSGGGQNSGGSGGSGRGSGGGGVRSGSRRDSAAAKGGPASGQRSGIWMQSDKGWWFQYSNGTYPKNEWMSASGSGADVWYAFDESGYMRTDWFFTGGIWYYLNPAGGAMMTGWVQINGKWYYLEPAGNAKHPQGAMYANEKTPDGYTVDENGAWVK